MNEGDKCEVNKNVFLDVYDLVSDIADLVIKLHEAKRFTDSLIVDHIYTDENNLSVVALEASKRLLTNMLDYMRQQGANRTVKTVLYG